jgi:hypothetical protein
LAGVAHAKSYRAPRYDVTIAIEPAGGLLVTEEAVFKFEGGPFTRVFREIPRRRTDGIRDVEVWLDGQSLARGRAAGQADVRREEGGRLRITWHLPGVSDRTHTFALRYRVDGVAWPRGDADVVEWVALPAEHDYAIDESTVRVTWPATASLVGIDAVPRRAGANAGPEVHDEGDARVVRLTGLGKNASVEIRARFAQGTLVTAAPQWRQRELRAEETRPRAIALAATVFMLLGGAFLFLWLQSPRGSGPEAGGAAFQPEPPDDLPPALVAALASNGSVGAMPHVATLFDLASRGVLRVEEQPKRGWGSRRFTLQRTGQSAGLGDYERQLLAAVFKDDAEGAVEFGKIGRRVQSASRELGRTVRADLLARRWIDPERDRARRRLQGLALLLLLVAGIGIVPPLLVLDRLGPWPLLIPAAAALAAVIGLLLAGSISPLSDVGERVAARCRAFARHLRDVSRGKQSVPEPATWTRFVAYAAAVGLGVAWAKRMGAHGAPAWFRGLAGEGDHGAAFVAAMSAGTHAGGHGGAGAGGGGAAGGGASGAS